MQIPSVIRLNTELIKKLIKNTSYDEYSTVPPSGFPSNILILMASELTRKNKHCSKTNSNPLSFSINNFP